jgi:lysophospholipase L1-like esterase
MSPKFLLLAAVLIILPSAARADLLVQDGQSVAFLGDSITFQGWQVPGGYVKLVTAGFATLGVHIKPVPAGVGGNTSKDMLARLDRDVIAKKPDWMTLSCGVNDVWHGANGVALEPYEANITQIVDQCTAANIKVPS